MPPTLSLHFGPYRLEGPQGPLWHQAEMVAVPPKALAVLWLLARQAGQVVQQSDAARHGVGRDGGQRGDADHLSEPPAPRAGRGRPAAALHCHRASRGVSVCGARHPGGSPPSPGVPARRRPRRGWWAARRNSPSCTLASPRRGRAPARPSSSRGRRGWAKRPWWRRLWRRWPRRRRPGSGAGSASTTMGRAKRICRCSTPWGD